MNFEKMSLNDIEREGYRLYNIAGRDKDLWKQCTDCFLYLMKHSVKDSKKAQYANTLGYIYYYGRTSDFVPDYREAFNYFSIGAEGGYYESMYKLGDMYLNGYYVEKNPEQAVKLYTQVYEQVERQFREEEFRGVFADIALRLGSLYRKGIGCSQDDRKALFIFTMADYAIKERMRGENFFGNRKVADSITKELTELQAKLGVDTQKEVIEADYPQVLPLALTDGFAGRVRFHRDGDRVAIEITRVDSAQREGYWVPRTPVIFSEYGYIRFLDEITETACGVTEFDQFENNKDGILIDEIRYDDKGNRYEFCRQGKIAAAIQAERFEFRMEREGE